MIILTVSERVVIIFINLPRVTCILIYFQYAPARFGYSDFTLVRRLRDDLPFYFIFFIFLFLFLHMANRHNLAATREKSSRIFLIVPDSPGQLRRRSTPTDTIVFGFRRRRKSTPPMPSELDHSRSIPSTCEVLVALSKRFQWLARGCWTDHRPSQERSAVRDATGHTILFFSSFFLSNSNHRAASFDDGARRVTNTRTDVNAVSSRINVCERCFVFARSLSLFLFFHEIKRRFDFCLRPFATT